MTQLLYVTRQQKVKRLELVAVVFPRVEVSRDRKIPGLLTVTHPGVQCRQTVMYSRGLPIATTIVSLKPPAGIEDNWGGLIAYAAIV
jgi:hypothetical protein